MAYLSYGAHIIVIIVDAEEEDSRASMLNSHTLCLGNWQTWLLQSNMAAPIVLTAIPGEKYYN